ncbi:hypothetical protein ARMSODRAFT_844459, partial [Armillaria solidipes]
NPGAFHGKRKEFLLAEHDGYRKAMQEDRVAKQLADITCRFFKRFAISLPDDIEPTKEELSYVDD